MRHPLRNTVATCLGALAVLASCGNQNPPPLLDPIVSVDVSCSAQIQPCVGGVAADQTCLAYGPPQPLAFPGGCTAATQCSDNCALYAKAKCVEPECRLVPSSVVVTTCGSPKNKCGARSNPPGAQNKPSPGQNVPDDPNAPYRILSFEYTLSSIVTPPRVIPISAAEGTPVAIDISGLVGTISRFPSSFTGYDISTNPATFTIPPQSLIDIPSALSISEPQGLIGNAVVGDVVGVSLYDVSPTAAKRTARVQVGPVTALDLDPLFSATTTFAAITTAPARLQVGRMSAPKQPPPLSLQSPGIDVTTGSDVWAVRTSAGNGAIIRATLATGTLLAQQAFAGDPIAVGGASSVDTSTPGAIVVLVATPTGAELRWYLGGAIATAPVVLALNDFPNATPVGMKVISVDNVQYAWVSLLTPTTNVVALYNLATKTHLKPLDVDLNALEPIGLTAGIAGACDLCEGNDSYTGNQTALLHVLVKSN